MTGLSNNAVATTLFAIVAALVGADLVSDALEGVSLAHVGVEGLGAALALMGAVVFYRQLLLERREAASWRAQAQELLAGVGAGIEVQFETWKLTAAEQEVALLLLKGLSFKEIAAVRETSERTARGQARLVYKKAGLGGRAELSAWFIEDLLPGSA